MTAPGIFERLEHLLLVVLACSALAAFGASYEQPLAWLLAAPCALSVFWQIPGAPGGLRRAARILCGVALVGTVLLGLQFMAYPILSGQVATRLTLTAGYSLGIFVALYLLGTRVWRIALDFLPAAIGLLAVAGFNPVARITPLLLAPGGAMFLFLVLRRREQASGRVAWVTPRLVLSAVATTAVAAAVLVGLPQLQSGVERVTAAWFQAREGGFSTFSSESRLGDLDRLKLSQRVVMRASTPRPLKLRGRAFPRFDGQTWRALAMGESPLLIALDSDEQRLLAGWSANIPGNSFYVSADQMAQVAVPDLLRTRIVQSLPGGLLLVPEHPVLVRAPVNNLRRNPFGTFLTPLDPPVEIYGVIHRRYPAPDPAEQLSAEIQREYLALPAELDPRWTELAARLAEGASTPEERVRKTVEYVEHAAEYSLDVGRFQTKQPVTEFLFEKKRGYCQYFASAAAILLRLQGIPSRYVVGFNVQEWNRLGKHYVVREADAHAWVEAFLPATGWVEADPTPDAEFQVRLQRAPTNWLAQAGEWMAAGLREFAIWVSQGDWREAFSLVWQGLRATLRLLFVEGWRVTLPLILLGGGGLLYRRWRRKKVKPPRPAPRVAARGIPAPLEELLALLDRRWTQAGFARPAFRAPLEHLESIPPQKLPGELLATSRKAVQCFYDGVFAGRAASEAELRALQEELRG